MSTTPDHVPEEEGYRRHAPPAGGETPEQLLERLKRELAQKETNLGGLTQQRDNLKAQVETLSKTVADIKKAEEGYGQALPGLDEARNKLFAHFEAEKKGVEANLGEKRQQQVLDAVGEVEGKVKAQREKVVQPAEERASQATHEADQAKAGAEQEQKAYDDLKSLPKKLGDNIKKLKEFEDRAESYDRQTKPASEYVILLEQETLFADTEVPSAGDYAKKLNAAAKELDAARVTEREKKQAADAASAALKKAQDDLKKLEDSRVADSLKAVEELN